MNGIERSTDAEMVYPAGADDRLSPSSEAPGKSELTRDNVCAKTFTTTAKEMLTHVLTGSGFIHIAAGAAKNFDMLVREAPDESADATALKPGRAAELVAWVTRMLSNHPATAADAQAHVDPQRAVSLLK